MRFLSPRRCRRAGRRPRPSRAQDMAPMSPAYLQLISGAQPILGQQLVRTVASN